MEFNEEPYTPVCITSGIKEPTSHLRWSKEGKLQQLWIDPHYDYEYNREWREVPTEGNE